jgi:collagen type III alpha
MQLDRDGDGKISREEAPEPMRPYFDQIDENQDGFLDRQEVNSLRRRFGGRGGGAPGPGGAGPGGRGGSRGLMQLDTDGDGKISKEEAPEPMRAAFDSMDANGDGFIDREEADQLRQKLGGAGGAPAGGGGPGAPRGGFGRGPGN